MQLHKLACAALLLCMIACGNESPPPTPPSFDRPGRVAFVCFQTSGRGAPRPWPMRYCENKEAQEATEADLSMHALVTQTSRGEVAAVDLETRRVLDSRKDIPGYTFLPVGELPSAIVVPRDHPKQTYVANYGSRSITVLRTGAFRDLSVGESATLQTVDLHLPGQTKSLAPVDMVVTPDEDALLVVAPDSGKLLRIPITRCAQSDASDAGVACEDGLLDGEAMTEIPLTGSLDLAVVVDDAHPEIEPYKFVCNADGLLPAPQHVGASLPADAAAHAPEPVALAVDAFCQEGKPCTRRVLIADRAQPIVHVLDVDALAAGTDALMPPIVTGVPTSAVAVTPRVPRSRHPADGETQYVYAVDATDGSVIVTQDGQVLSVSSDPATRPDRIALGIAQATGNPVATSLAVLTPGFDVTKAASQYARTSGNGPLCVDDNHPQYTQDDLRGVFLAIGVSDGTVRIVDVHDMELAPDQCRTCDAEHPDPYPVLRHHTRIAVSYDPKTSLPNMAPQTVPSFSLDTGTFVVAIDGTVREPRVEGLSCVPCAAPLLAAFPDPADVQVTADAGVEPSKSSGTDGEDAGVPDGGATGAVEVIQIAHGPGLGHRCPEGEARVCALGDPWSTVDSWLAIFEGTIPGTQGGHGRFIETASSENKSGGLELTGEIDFCSGGAEAGDQVVITSPMPPAETIDAGSRDACAKLDALRDDGAVIGFRIRRVFGDRVQIDERLTNTELPSELNDWSLVQKCFANMLMAFDIRTHGAFTVVTRGNRLGFEHRNVLDEATGRCEIDTAQSPLRRGRAYWDKPFTNSVISFEIASHRGANGKRIDPKPGSSLNLSMSSAAPKLEFDGSATSYSRVQGVLPVDLQYNDVNQQLYVVDQALRGLIPVPTNPFPSTTSSSFQ